MRYFWLIILVHFFALTYPLAAKAEVDPPFELPSQSELSRLRSAIIYTNKGQIAVRLFPEDAPWHVANFKYLSDKGFYKNLKFHLYEPSVAIQTGAPTAKLDSGPGYTIPPEFNKNRHEYGTLTMVRKPNDLDLTHSRRSHGSQFRIMLARSPFMDGQYVVFGKVIAGFDVLKRLRLGDTVQDIKVFVRDDR